MCIWNEVCEHKIDMRPAYGIPYTSVCTFSLTCWHFGLCLNALNAQSDKPLLKNTFIYFNEVVPWMRLFICLLLLLTMFMLFLWIFFFLLFSLFSLLAALMAKTIAAGLRERKRGIGGCVLLSVFSLYVIMQTHTYTYMYFVCFAHLHMPASFKWVFAFSCIFPE